MDFEEEGLVRHRQHFVPVQERTRKPTPIAVEIFQIGLSCPIAEKCVLPVSGRHAGPFGRHIAHDVSNATSILSPMMLVYPM